jgi:hypothetical protein
MSRPDRPSYSISAIKIEIVPFCQVIFKSKDSSETKHAFGNLETFVTGEL